MSHIRTDRSIDGYDESVNVLRYLRRVCADQAEPLSFLAMPAKYFPW
jgi:hypothetical protein